MKHFGKSVLTALLVFLTVLVGITAGCEDLMQEESGLRSIAITSPPTKTVYALGDVLDLSGLVVTGTYADGTTKTETVSLSAVSGYNANTLGEQTLTVTVNGKTATFSVSVIELVDVGDVGSYLAGAAGGDTAANSVPLDVDGVLASGGWDRVLSAIASADKYVSLNLSVCLMDGIEFDPGLGADGADKVTALVLPDTVKSIKAGDYDKPTFKDFTALGAVSGVGIEIVGDSAFESCTSLVSVSLPVARTIGDSAFESCTSLVSVSLPAARTIGHEAFTDCTSLAFVSLPAARTIGTDAFWNCDNLASVSLPAATDIGGYAFAYCTSLTSVSLPTSLTTVDSNPFPGCVNLTTITVAPANTTFSTRDGMLLDKAETTLIGYPSASGTVTLPFTTIGGMAFEGCDNLAFVSLPAATSIGGFAFWHCDNLTTVSLPAATSIGRRSFELCRALTTVSLPTTPPSLDGGIFSYIDSTGTITVSVPTGAVPAYTSAWGVDANTPAGGNHSVYGENHKAVLITDN